MTGAESIFGRTLGHERMFLPEVVSTYQALKAANPSELVGAIEVGEYSYSMLSTQVSQSRALPPALIREHKLTAKTDALFLRGQGHAIIDYALRHEGFIPDAVLAEVGTSLTAFRQTMSRLNKESRSVLEVDILGNLRGEGVYMIGEEPDNVIQRYLRAQCIQIYANSEQKTESYMLSRIRATIFGLDLEQEIKMKRIILMLGYPTHAKSILLAFTPDRGKLVRDLFRFGGAMTTQQLVQAGYSPNAVHHLYVAINEQNNSFAEKLIQFNRKIKALRINPDFLDKAREYVLTEPKVEHEVDLRIGEIMASYQSKDPLQIQSAVSLLMNQFYRSFAEQAGRALGGDFSEGEDVAQDTIIKIDGALRRNIYQIRDDASFSSYCMTIFYNVLKDKLRSRGKATGIDSSVEWEEAIGIGTPTLEDETFERFDKQVLYEIISTFTGKRADIWREHLRGAKSRDIAALLDIPVGKVYTEIRLGELLVLRRIAKLRDESNW